MKFSILWNQLQDEFQCCISFSFNVISSEILCGPNVQFINKFPRIVAPSHFQVYQVPWFCLIFRVNMVDSLFWFDVEMHALSILMSLASSSIRWNHDHIIRGSFFFKYLLSELCYHSMLFHIPMLIFSNLTVSQHSIAMLPVICQIACWGYHFFCLLSDNLGEDCPVFENLFEFCQIYAGGTIGKLKYASWCS